MVSLQPAYHDTYSLMTAWDIKFTINHWSDEEKMKKYITSIIIPYNERKLIKLSVDHSALAIYDEFKGQLTPGVFSLLEANNVLVVKAPPNCSHRLQPMDHSINKAVKEFLRKKFQHWYSLEVESLCHTNESFIPVDLSMSKLKPLGADWLVVAYCYLQKMFHWQKMGFVPQELPGP